MADQNALPGGNSTNTTSEDSNSVPKKVVRLDDWWLKGKSQPDQPAPPPLPARSPLRNLLSNLPFYPLPEQLSRYFARPSQLEDLQEQEELRAQLSPPPLHIVKSSPTSPTTPQDSTAQRKTFGPPETQARLEEAPEVSPITRERALKSVLSKDSFNESTKANLAEKVEAAENSFKQNHRKLTLEALEGSPIPPEVKEATEFGLAYSFESGTVRRNMDSLHPESAAALTAHRREAIRLAKSQERAVAERCNRSNQEVPGYTFDELIGKGSFGRVYKGFVCVHHLLMLALMVL